MAPRKVFVVGASLDKETDAWVKAKRRTPGWNFSQWVRGKIREDIKKEEISNEVAN